MWLPCHGVPETSLLHSWILLPTQVQKVLGPQQGDERRDPGLFVSLVKEQNSIEKTFKILLALFRLVDWGASNLADTGDSQLAGTRGH